MTQRGNRREDIFFTDEDREAYLLWLREYSDKHQVEILAYCLMTNHIHLVAVPATDDGLHRVLKPLHMRYHQPNPVRAGMERRAEDYRWSSATAHCGNISDGLLNLESGWSKQFAAIDDWSVWLAEGDATEENQILRQNVEKGLPCGNAGFVQRLGKMVGRPLEYRPQGRPRKAEGE